MSGIGGYGYWYLKTLLEECDPGTFVLVGAVDPRPEGSALFATLRQAGVPVHDTLEHFFAAGGSADLVVISSPIHHHVPQAIAALAHGAHVLCDKPLGAAVAEADDLIAARNASDRWVSIGYQWSFSPGIRLLKADLLDGRWGRPLRAATLCLWPRDFAYYARNEWAGRMRAPDGRPILDSPLNNAMAHFIHNLLYLLGPESERSAEPAAVTADTARAYGIETADTIGVRVETAHGAGILFLGSHASAAEHPPVFRIECEKGVITHDGGLAPIRGTATDGTEILYPSPEESHQFAKLFRALEWAGGDSPGGIGVHGTHAGAGAESGIEVICPPEAARAQTVVVERAAASMPEAVAVPEDRINRAEDGSRLWIAGLDSAFCDCYRSGRLPSELEAGSGLEWARAGERID